MRSYASCARTSLPRCKNRLLLAKRQWLQSAEQAPALAKGPHRDEVTGSHESNLGDSQHLATVGLRWCYM